MILQCKVCLCDIKPDLLLESHEGISDVYRCPKCKVGFAHPQPSSQILNEYYDGMYSDLTVSFDKKKMKWARTSMDGYGLEISRILSKEIKDSTFLDLGGGLGYYTKAAEEKGFKATLVEKDPKSVTFAADKLGIKNILKLDMQEFFKNNKTQYDIVFFRHVIEHVTDPQEVIKGVSSLIKKNGLLIIETDNNAGIEILFKGSSRKFYLELYRKKFKGVSFFSLLNKRPFALDPPRHLYGFRMQNLTKLLQSQNLEPQKRVHYRLGHPIYWPNIPSPKLKSALKNLRSLKVRSFLIELGAYLNLVFRKLLQAIGLSSGICIYAQKQ